MKENSNITLRTLTKSNVWDLQENDIFALWHKPEKEDNISERGPHYMDIVRTAFDVEEIKIPKREIIAKYEERGFVVNRQEKSAPWKKRSHAEDAIRRIRRMPSRPSRR